MRRFEVYTLRRTSSRTVYAIYDNQRSEPVCYDDTQRPVTTTDRALAASWARDRNREQDTVRLADAFTPPDPFSRKA